MRTDRFPLIQSRITLGSLAAALAGTLLTTACADAPTSPQVSVGQKQQVVAAPYVIEIIGHPQPALGSHAMAVNDHGVTVGQAAQQTSPGVVSWRAFRWNGTWQDLGTLPGHKSSGANDINNKGYVVGFSSDANELEERAVLWKPDNTIVDLGHPDSIGETFAEAINERNVIVGHTTRFVYKSYLKLYKTEAFVWTPSAGFKTLGDTFDISMAYDVNEEGYIVGMAGHHNEEHAVIWRPDGSVVDLGTTSGAWARALAMNDRLHITGRGETIDISVQAFEWKPGTSQLSELGSRYYEGLDVSNTGQIVGTLRSSPAAFTLENGQGIALPTLSSGSPDIAEGVNDCGIIVGRSDDSMNVPRAVRWYRPDVRCLKP